MPRNSAKKRIPRFNTAVNSAVQYRGNPNSAARLKIPRPRKTVGPTDQWSIWMQAKTNGFHLQILVFTEITKTESKCFLVY